MNLKWTKYAFVSLFLSTAAVAITFEMAERPDPFSEGKKCFYPELISYGGYVHSWPSKYDFVFEPHVSLIAACSDSGYISFVWDFNTLTESEKDAVGEFLAENSSNVLSPEKPWNPYANPDNFHDMFDQMEAIYSYRELTLEDRAYLYRALAWQWRDNPKADEYRSKALAVHDEILANGESEGFDLITNLYVVGFYNWRQGHTEKADDYFEQALSVKWTDENGMEQTGSKYIEELISEIKAGKADDEVRFAEKE